MVCAKGRAILVTLTVLLACATFALAQFDSHVSDARKALANEDQVGDLINIPSGREGIVLFLGREIKPGEKVRDSDQFTFEIDGKSIKYRRLRIGDTIEKGQVIGRLGDGLARSEVSMRIAKLKATQEEKQSSEKMRDEAWQRWLTAKQFRMRKVADTSLEELRGAMLTYDRYVYETKSKEEAIKVAEAELNRAKAILDSFQIRSGVRGIVRRIHKRPGEAVQALETVVTLELIGEN